MADRIRFHLDEHVDPAIAAALRRAGIDVTTTIQARLRTQDDEAHLRFARDEGRVIPKKRTRPLYPSRSP